MKSDYYNINQSPLYKLTTKKKLAQLLKIEPGSLFEFAKGENYKIWKTKKNREIQEPCRPIPWLPCLPVGECRRAVPGANTGNLISILFGRAYREDHKIQHYEMTNGFHGDESYQYLVKWDKKEQKWKLIEQEDN